MHTYTNNTFLQLSGSLMVASLVEVLIGGLGVVGPMLKRIGPLTVAPSIGLIGLALFRLPVIYAKYNPAIALGSATFHYFACWQDSQPLSLHPSVSPFSLCKTGCKDRLVS